MVKKNLALILISAITTISVASVVILQTTKEETITQTEELIVIPLYTAKEYNDRLAIYEYGKRTPLYFTDIYVDNFPYGEQIMLEDGINIYTEEQLNSLMEDYDVDQIIYEY